MNNYLAGCLLLTVALASILPGFPILMLLRDNFPNVPELITIDTVFMYFAQACLITFLGFLSMCVYSDIACPLAIKGFVYVFSRM